MNKKIIGLLSLVVVAGLFLTPAFSLAQIPPAAGGDITVSPSSPPAYSADQALGIITTVINYVFGFLLAIVVLMIIVAGYLFVTGGGNPEQIGKARNFLMYALIGLAIAVIARGLVALVGRILGHNITV